MSTETGGQTHRASMRVLLIWDAPNMDMGLSAIVGGRPSPHQRPRFEAIGRWLLEKGEYRAQKRGLTLDDVAVDATLFTNVTNGNRDGLHSWIDALRNIGFAVYAKPKETADSDVDANMLDYLQQCLSDEIDLDSVVIASADGRNFQETLDDLAAQGVRCTVLGFAEECAWARDDENLKFIDVEHVPGMFQQPLPRVSLDNLPSGGAWLHPFRPLRKILDPLSPRTTSIAATADEHDTSAQTDSTIEEKQSEE